MNSQNTINKLGTLFKYVSDSPNIIDGIFLNKKIRFTQPAALNDPLEFNPAIRFDNEANNYRKYSYNGILMPSVHDWYRLNLIESRINSYGILSLTDNPFSFEMWSQYANGHKGILIEFKIQNKLKPEIEISPGLQLKAHKVRYVKKYHVNIDRLEQNKKTIPFYRIRDMIFLRKTNHWRHEREFRVIRKLDEWKSYNNHANRTSYRDNHVYLFPINLDCISSVTFGIYTPRELKCKIIDICKGTNIQFLQTLLLKEPQNEIKIASIDDFGTTDNFLNLLPQLFAADTVELKHREPIIIKSLSEIPHYHSQSKDYEEYYQRQLSKQQ